MAVSGRSGGSGAFRSTTTDPIGNYRFLVHFYPQQPDRQTTPWLKPTGMMGFSSVSGLSYNVQTMSIREGGYNTTLRQVPTQVDFSALQLDRGILIGSRQNWDWMRTLLRVVQGRGSGNKVLYRSDVQISVLQTPVQYGGGGFRAEDATADAAYNDKVVMRFRLYNAWPSGVVYSDLNAGDNALMVERMTLVHEGLDVEWGSVDSRGLVVSAGNFGNP